MFKNEITLLKQENEKQSLKLKDEDDEVIKDIMGSMSIFKVNSYDSQVIRRDLIGMTQELNLRNSNLNESIDNNPKKFANDIIMNSNGPSKMEIFLKFISMLSGYFIAWSIMFAFGSYQGLSWNVNPKYYIFYIGAVFIIFITETIIATLFSTQKPLKKLIPFFIIIILSFILLFVLKPINSGEYAYKMNVKYVIGISTLVYLISKYLSLRNIRKLSKNNLNYVQDLK